MCPHLIKAAAYRIFLLKKKKEKKKEESGIKTGKAVCPSASFTTLFKRVLRHHFGSR